MLKKHIRTHTDLRPYTCRQCNFSFKTKGNLTKHMKSKAHHKKCTELGISPVPTSVEEANIDEDSLARQESLKKLNGTEPESDDLDDEEDEDEDDEDEDGEEEEEDVDVDESGQFEDAGAEQAMNEREQEVARSLLDLGVMAPAGCKPTTYPYASHFPLSSSTTSILLQEEEEEEEEEEEVEEEEESEIDDEEDEEEEEPVMEEEDNQPPMDLSAPRKAPALAPATDSLITLPSIPTSPSKGPNASSHAHSGMLQAYLTEKALKEGLLKAQNSKSLPVIVPVSVPVLIRPNVIREMHPVTSRAMPVFSESLTGRGRPEFVIPTSGSGFGNINIQFFFFFFYFHFFFFFY